MTEQTPPAGVDSVATARSGLRLGLRMSTRSSGGGLVFVSELARALVASSECTEVTLFALGDVGRLDLPPGVRVVPVAPGSSALKRRTLDARAMAAAVRANPVDVLVCPGTELTKVKGVPTLLWPLTVAPFEAETVRVLGTTPRRRLRWLVLRGAVLSSCRRADGFVFSSHYARSLYARNQPSVARCPTTVVHPGPSLQPGEAAGQAPTRELPEPFLLFVSHLYPYKMVVELVDGFARCTRDPGFTEHLVLAGRAVDPGYEHRLRALVRERGLEDRVHLLGALDKSELDVLYRRAEAFVFPSLSENAGSYALIDAFAYGLPVISSLTSSMPEICQGAARFIDPRDPEHIAEQIALVTADAHLRRELANRSMQRARDFPDWDEIAHRLVRFAGSVVDGAPRPLPQARP